MNNFVFPESIDNIAGCKEVLNRAPEVLSELGKIIGNTEIELQKARARVIISNSNIKREELRAKQDTDEDIVKLQQELSEQNAIYSLWKEGQINARAFHKELTQS